MPPAASVLVVTPVRDGASFIADTMRSVLSQTAVVSGRVRLEYVIADGGSSDGTVALAHETGGDAVEVVSRPDHGMYDALADTWERAGPADVMSYLNAGDLWQPTAIDTVLDIMQQTDAAWICGQRLLYNEAGQPTSVSLPFRYRRRLLAAGIYDGRLPHIQQESTFWSAALMDEVDLAELRTFRLAGDHYLWSRFARRTEPLVAEALLGGFRAHGGQLSERTDEYRAEVARASRVPGMADRLLAAFDRPLWYAPPAVKQRLNPNLVRFDHGRGVWR